MLVQRSCQRTRPGYKRCCGSVCRSSWHNPTEIGPMHQLILPCDPVSFDPGRQKPFCFRPSPTSTAEGCVRDRPSSDIGPFLSARRACHRCPTVSSAESHECCSNALNGTSTTKHLRVAYQVTVVIPEIISVHLSTSTRQCLSPAKETTVFLLLLEAVF
jgi:hypothetical protein